MDDEELRARGPAGLDPERKEALRASLLADIDADERLRAQVPVGLDADRHRALRSTSLAEASTPRTATDADELTEADPLVAAAPGPRRRGLAAARVAAGIVALGVVAAIAVAVASSDDPEGVATEPPTATVPETADLRELGLDVDLDAERVTCIAATRPDARRFDEHASAIGDRGAITEDSIRRVCQTDVVGTDGTRTVGVEVCRDPAVAHPHPIQLLGGGSCADRDLVALAEDDLVVLNAARDDEVALELAVAALGSCPSAEEVARVAASVLTERDADLRLVVDDEAAGCHQVAVSWVDGTATVAPAP